MEIHVKPSATFVSQIRHCLQQCCDELTAEDHEALSSQLEQGLLDIRHLQLVRKIGRGRIRLHEILAVSDDVVLLPRPTVSPRNPELEARVQRLKKELAEREYRDMTRDVDLQTHSDDPLSLRSVGQQLRIVDRQLITVFNMVFTVGGVFVFFYHCSKYLFNGESYFAGQLLTGATAAFVVFVADMYFLISRLDS